MPLGLGGQSPWVCKWGAGFGEASGLGVDCRAFVSA